MRDRQEFLVRIHIVSFTDLDLSEVVEGEVLEGDPQAMALSCRMTGPQAHRDSDHGAINEDNSVGAKGPG